MKNSYGKISRSGGSKRDFSKKISSFRTVFRTQSLYLPQIWSSVRSQNDGMKRESGANPGQSRCCKLQNGLGNSFMPLTRVGKALIPEVSQKTCNAYFFDGFEDRPEENCEAVGFCLSLFPFPVAIYLFLIILP